MTSQAAFTLSGYILETRFSVRRRPCKVDLGVGPEVGPLREVLAEQSVDILVRPALPWALRVAEVDGATPVSTLTRACWAISLPWSHVIERRSSAGSSVILAARASATTSAVWPFGSATSITNRP